MCYLGAYALLSRTPGFSWQKSAGHKIPHCESGTGQPIFWGKLKRGRGEKSWSALYTGEVRKNPGEKFGARKVLAFSHSQTFHDAHAESDKNYSQESDLPPLSLFHTSPAPCTPLTMGSSGLDRANCSFTPEYPQCQHSIRAYDWNRERRFEHCQDEREAD